MEYREHRVPRGVLLPEARHFPQLDEPEEVARLILSTPLAAVSTDHAPDDATDYARTGVRQP